MKKQLETINLDEEDSNEQPELPSQVIPEPHIALDKIYAERQVKAG